MNISQQLKRKRDREHFRETNQPSVSFYEDEDGEVEIVEGDDYLSVAVEALNGLTGELELIAGEGINIEVQEDSGIIISNTGGVSGSGEVIPRVTDEPTDGELHIRPSDNHLYINDKRLVTDKDLDAIDTKLDKIIKMIEECCNGGGTDPDPEPSEGGYEIGYGLLPLDWSLIQDDKEMIYDVGYNVTSLVAKTQFNSKYQYGYKSKIVEWDVTLIEKPKEE